MFIAISHFFTSLLPWFSQFLFGGVIKKAGKEALKIAPVDLKQPNILLIGILVIVVNGFNFLIHYLYPDKTAVLLVSTTIITVVTAGFLLKGFIVSKRLKESIVLLSALIIIYTLFVITFLVFDIRWLALIAKLTVEVLLGFSVMHAETHRLTNAQAKAADVIIDKFSINPDGAVGKFLEKSTSDTDKA